MRSLRHFNARLRWSHRWRYGALRWVGGRTGARVHPGALVVVASLLGLVYLLWH